MNKQKIIKYTLIAIPLLFLAKWGIETIIYDLNKIPDINPHPTQKVRIHGKFPFAKDVNMKIVIHYLTTNPKCEYVTNWLEGTTPRPRHKENVFSTTITKDSNYEAIVYLDYFAPSVCQWEADSIYVYMDSKRKHIEVFGGTNALAKKDVNVSWESNPLELYQEGNIIFESDLEIYKQIGRSRTEYERLYPKKVHFPSNIQIGTIDYKNLSLPDKSFDLECVKEKYDNNRTFIICDKDKVVKGSKVRTDPGYDWKINISSLQKEVQFNFIDKGWIK